MGLRKGGAQGGYRATRKNRNMLKKYKSGRSIGFTARASLKAKGLLPRSNGRYVLGPKYSGAEFGVGTRKRFKTMNHGTSTCIGSHTCSGTKRFTQRYRYRGGMTNVVMAGAENNIEVRRANYRNWWQQWKAAVLSVGRGQINVLPPEVGGARPVNPDFQNGVGGLPPPPLPILIHARDEEVFNEGLTRLGLSPNPPYLPL